MAKAKETVEISRVKTAAWQKFNIIPNSYVQIYVVSLDIAVLCLKS